MRKGANSTLEKGKLVVTCRENDSAEISAVQSFTYKFLMLERQRLQNRPQIRPSGSHRVSNGYEWYANPPIAGWLLQYSNKPECISTRKDSLRKKIQCTIMTFHSLIILST